MNSDQDPRPPQYAPPSQLPPPQFAPSQSVPPQYASPHQSIPPQYTPQHESVPPQYAPPPQSIPPQYASPQYARQPQYVPQPPHAPQPPYAASLPRPAAGEPFDGAAIANDLLRPLYGANPLQSVARFFKNYVNFTGRASRSEFWWVALLFWSVWLVLGVIGAVVSEVNDALGFGLADDAIGPLLGLIVVAVALGTLIPWISLTWRRLHDANLAGPLYLLILIPYLGSLIILILAMLTPQPMGRRFDQQRYM